MRGTAGGSAWTGRSGRSARRSRRGSRSASPTPARPSCPWCGRWTPCRGSGPCSGCSRASAPAPRTAGAGCAARRRSRCCTWAGLANGLANLHNARRARTPVVNLVGDMATWHRAADAPLTSDIASLARPVSGWVRTAGAAATLAEDTAAAIGAARSGLVATLIAPADVQAGDAPPGPDPVAPPPPRPPPATTRSTTRPGPWPAARPSCCSAAPGCPPAVCARRRASRWRPAPAWSETFPARQERGDGLPAPRSSPTSPSRRSPPWPAAPRSSWPARRHRSPSSATRACPARRCRRAPRRGARRARAGRRGGAGAGGGPPARPAAVRRPALGPRRATPATPRWLP